MITMREVLQKEIEQILHELELENPKVNFDYPARMDFGDLSTNVAMAYAKQLGKNPLGLAEQIKEKLTKDRPSLTHIQDIEAVAPGFINFYFDPAYFAESVEEVLKKGKDFGKNNNLSGKKILVEHSSPNLFKAFHIGHVMNNAIGESISRLARFSGADVTVISYPSDISLGIAKAVWALMKDNGLEKLKQINIPSQVVAYLGDCYVKGTRAYDDSPELQPRIREIAHLISNKEGLEYKTYLEGRELNLAYFKAITSTLGSTFDDFIFESEAGVEGEKIVRDHIGSIFDESEGAVIYRGEQDGLHTRVFINREGYPTYEAKDIGLLSLKFSKYNPDLSIFVTDHEQEEYFKVVSAAAGKINPVWKEKTVHVTHGRMTLKGQKMSSRLGGVPSAQELLDILYKSLNEIAPDLANETDGVSNKDIAVGALKFTILRSAPGMNIDFNPDTFRSFEGDSGSYLQYATVRANSLLKKAAGAESAGDTEPAGERAEGVVHLDIGCPNGWMTTDLERKLERFPGVVEKAGREYAPHYIVTYLTELAGEFNSFYASHKIIDETDPSSPYRLALTKAFATVMTSGLNLLGIKVPVQM